TLLNSEETGSFFALHISSENDAKREAQRLRRVLEVVPYLDWEHQPTITPTATANNWLVNLALYDENHLTDFIKRLEEDQFFCQTAKI
ncbi:MAG: hypothetical protein AAGJ82_09545, partial [Bacteroidota bacterium]